MLDADLEGKIHTFDSSDRDTPRYDRDTHVDHRFWTTTRLPAQDFKNAPPWVGSCAERGRFSFSRKTLIAHMHLSKYMMFSMIGVSPQRAGF